MNLISPTSPSPSSSHSHSSERTDAHDLLFAQGADLIAQTSDAPHLHAGLWFKNTPTYQGQTIGTIGGCELGKQTSARAVQFLGDCAHYLHHTQRCQSVVGPMNGNTWLKHRLIIESNQRPPFLMEPVEPEHFLQTFQATGFSILSEYSSSLIDLTLDQPDFSSLEARLAKRGVRIRPINPKSFETDLVSLFKLSLQCFSNNFLYTPIDESTFVQKYKTSQQHINPEFVLLAEQEVDDHTHDRKELVGYVFGIPDLSAIQQNKPPALIVKTLAVLPDRKFSGLGTLLVGQAHQHAKTLGHTEAIHALQHQNNTSHRISQRFNAQIFRRYALMEYRVE